MKNITVSLPDDVYWQARIKAAEVDKFERLGSVVLNLVEEESDFERHRRLQDEALATINNFRAGDRLTRDAVHERHGVR